jgi:S-adenosylmethionine:tRNA ribosyltransferase-isomerase
MGVEVEALTLHIGYGTFSPIRVKNIFEHQMHDERYEIPNDLVLKLKDARREGRRIIAVGTSALRALESLESVGPCGETSLFIKPGFQFSWVNGLITNFHLPKSSLFVLVAAFMGLEAAKESYQSAISANYRLFSYGDAMLIL